MFVHYMAFRALHNGMVNRQKVQLVFFETFMEFLGLVWNFWKFSGRLF
jgi:hypothetical protein